jgi:diaminohydroxyphosphoribosylaminopyrimidine deaminase/5-amino-6-(5-phosphoribosylamino)uracil reductase
MHVNEERFSADSVAVARWMDRALELAQDPHAARGENPRVGCVVLDARGDFAGEGYHAGAGTAHAEVVALAQAGAQAAGGTAIVTLEPCRHQGRTGPCTQALLAAGITRVVFAQADPTFAAGGGADELRAAGIEVIGGIEATQAEAVNREWSVAVQRGTPFVTAKMAVSLDGRVAGEGGRRVQLTGPQAIAHAHELRARVQAVVTGTGTVICDDPSLTVRHATLPVSGPALRVVMGRRPVPETSAILDDAAPTLVLHERDPAAVLRDLYARGIRHVLLEAGPTLLRAFWEAGCVDELHWLVAGVWLGAGPHALARGERLDDRVDITETHALGEDVLLRCLPMPIRREGS